MAIPKKPNRNRDTKADTGYRWRDRDPILDVVNALVQASPMTYTQISYACGVSQSCLRNWDRGKTKRPQAVTVKFVLRAIGFELAIRRTSDNMVVPVPITVGGRLAKWT